MQMNGNHRSVQCERRKCFGPYYDLLMRTIDLSDEFIAVLRYLMHKERPIYFMCLELAVDDIRFYIRRQRKLITDHHGYHYELINYLDRVHHVIEQYMIDVQESDIEFPGRTIPGNSIRYPVGHRTLVELQELISVQRSTAYCANYRMIAEAKQIDRDAETARK
jgi:hypothetical protein